MLILWLHLRVAMIYRSAVIVITEAQVLATLPSHAGKDPVM
jgi:hypothetical protein